MEDKNKPLRIEKERLLLVEGQDEVEFFTALFRYLNIDNIQIINVEGKLNFRSKIKLLSISPDINTVKKIGAIRDADTNAQAAFDSLKDSFRLANWKPADKPNIFSDSNPSIGIFIMPGANKDNGMLEDLCLQSIKDQPDLRCVDDYINCIESLREERLNKLSKRKILTYLAGQQELVNALGLAAKKHIWNFDAPAFNELKAFLLELAR